ncbi:hypothetical protein ASPACDRAFT_44505 [Aspergillus aculeatus ATCC 16872]|uniref:Xylanolytic transcriptional activator regulatory domain-containing protein n=1 Tax=Aspergillus aculeatus (strain ATCC 16872 / CBS 172.66 / WB 5094) TaxID=690307 RepID=A0A1L9WSH6_ASPA1|nr:uncharacterized protein ASPACDRAFT_44505 [Aspergillus aculeatus ATCC 16872]OJJ98877.1 hypothetical protein ASPACDRAFT_44505 [Aspergillus aculeatus ATCC 16872]
MNAAEASISPTDVSATSRHRKPSEPSSAYTRSCASDVVEVMVVAVRVALSMASSSAQSIGLHRNQEHFKLTPLECELRRRLWWQICASDNRAAEDHGLSTELNGAFQRASRLSAGVLNSQNLMDSLEQLSEHVKEKIEAKYLRYCDPNIPLQKAAILLGRVFLGTSVFSPGTLYVRPDVPGAERAWELVNKSLSMTELGSRPSPGQNGMLRAGCERKH